MKLPDYLQTMYANLFTKYFRYVLVGTVALIFTLGYFLLIQSQFENVRLVGILALRNETARLNDRQAYLQRLTDMIDAYKTALGERPDLADNILPKSLDNGKIFLTMQAIANQSNMILNAVTINKSASGTSTTATIGNAASGAGATDTFDADISKILNPTSYVFRTASVSVTFGGTPEYETYKKLLKTIEQSALLLDLYQINFTNQATGIQQIGTLEKQQSQVNYSFELKMYYLESNEASTR